MVINNKHNTTSAVRSLSSLSSAPLARRQQHQDSSKSSWSWSSTYGGSWHWYGLAAAALLASFPIRNNAHGMTTTRCDSNDDDDDDDDTVEVDPYDNLPEKDEPTHCSICLTYRQGPCRPYWRKVEACTKDNELPDDAKKKDEDGNGDDTSDDDDKQRPDPPCFKYMMPWIDCASGYRNLYALIELDTNYTEGIADLESTASEHLCWAPGREPPIDWSPWRDYVEVLNPHWKLPPMPSRAKQSIKKRKNTRKNDDERNGTTMATDGAGSSTVVALWKTLDQSSDPELVQVEATVPTKLEGGVLECAYALDQDDHVIGFAYGTKPSEAASASSSEEDESEEEKTVALTIRLLPERTRHIVIAAAYTQVGSGTSSSADADDRNKNGSDDPPIESHLYKSRPYMLDVVGKQKEDNHAA